MTFSQGSGNFGPRSVIAVGTRFGRLTVVDNLVRKAKGTSSAWGCLLSCECGGTRFEFNGVLNSSKFKRTAAVCSVSCPLHKPNFRGGFTGEGNHPGWYRSYNTMKQRCLIRNSTSFHHYGGRGITICARWLKDPLSFYADMGDRPEGTSLDRIEVNGNYEPGNCRWADATTQAQNKRNSRV